MKKKNRSKVMFMLNGVYLDGRRFLANPKNRRLIALSSAALVIFGIITFSAITLYPYTKANATIESESLSGQFSRDHSPGDSGYWPVILAILGADGRQERNRERSRRFPFAGPGRRDSLYL